MRKDVIFRPALHCSLFKSPLTDEYIFEGIQFISAEQMQTCLSVVGFVA